MQYILSRLYLSAQNILSNISAPGIFFIIYHYLDLTGPVDSLTVSDVRRRLRLSDTPLTSAYRT